MTKSISYSIKLINKIDRLVSLEITLRKVIIIFENEILNLN